MVSNDQMKQILLDQRDAILQKSPGIERSIIGLIEKKLKLPHIVVLTGLRRSGKSTILRQIIKKYYQDRDFYYINFEDERLFNFKAENFNVIYESLLELFGEKKVFFIDEIQNVQNFEGFVRRFYDSGFKFFITGSSAKLLNKEIGTKLTGRHVDLIVRPFSFTEYLVLKNFKIDKNTVYSTINRAELKKHFANFLVNGGMPEYVIYNDQEVLSRVYEDIVIKDIVARYKIEDAKQIRELYQYLMATISQKFSYNSLKKFIGINSSNTIKKYIDYLEETYFISQINKFDYSLKKQIVNDKKIYVVDNGFISNVSIRFSKYEGWLLENLVFLELRKKGNVFYHSDKCECDFLLVENKKVTKAIQVCWNIDVMNKEREIKGIFEAMEKFKLKSGIILTNDQEEEMDFNGKKIIVMPVWKWILHDCET